MDILLTHAYYLENDPVEQRVLRLYAPLGILSLAAYLERQGFDVATYDTTFRSLDDFGEFLRLTHPAVVGIYVTMMTKTDALRMVKVVKSHGAVVIVGGPEPVYYAEEFLAHGVDLVVVGEGELTLRDALRAVLGKSSDFSSVPGLVFRDADGRPRRTEARGLIADLDGLPFPDRSKLDLTPYFAAWNNRHGFTSLSVVTMRGCPFTCSWCSHAVYGETYRRRSPGRVASELESLLAQYGPDQIWFADDVFTIHQGWLMGFARELADRGIAITYECITRADRMNEEVVRTLRESGCTRVWIGSESGSQRIIDAMSRRVQVEQIQAMAALARRNGIEVGLFVMFGYPGETRDDIELTVDHVRRARPDHVLTTVAYPIKGTALYEEIRDRLLLPPLPFAEWNDRMIDIAGRYPKRFYWWAHRRIVNEAAVSRLLVSPDRRWARIARAYVKAKIAHLGMNIVQ